MTVAYIESADYYVITKDHLFKYTSMNICFIIWMMEKLFKQSYYAHAFWTNKILLLETKNQTLLGSFN